MSALVQVMAVKRHAITRNNVDNIFDTIGYYWAIVR